MSTAGATRLHLSAVVLLASYLTEETAEELLAAAAHKPKSGIEQLLAERLPRPELPARVQAIAPSPTPPTEPLSPGTVGLHAPETVEPPPPRPKVARLSPQRFALEVTIAQSTHDKLRSLQFLGPKPHVRVRVRTTVTAPT